MCVNDPMGHYNVLYDGNKKEIFRIEVCDTMDPSVEGDGSWKTPAMKKKYEHSVLKKIEPFIVSGQLLGVGDFTYDWVEDSFV